MPSLSRAQSPTVSLEGGYAHLSLAEMDALLAQFDASSPASLDKYRGRPVAYLTERLGQQLTPKQAEIAHAVEKYPRTLVKASHGVGKTHLAAGMALYNYEVYVPSITLTTAPSFPQVVDLLWKQMRTQAPLGLPFLPAHPTLQDPSDEMHYAKGYTAKTADAFQGRHEERLFIEFDEAIGVKRPFWEAAEGMMSGPESRQLCIFNPTDTSTMAYQADRSPDWHSITVSALDHPNISAELRGDPPPFPKAVRLAWVESKVQDLAWCTPLSRGEERKATDFAWPPGSDHYYRPGPLFETRVMGRWASQSITSIWSDAAWDAAVIGGLAPPAQMPAELGCDVARFGDDNTVIHARRGGCSLLHESRNGMSIVQTASRLKEAAREQGTLCGLDGRLVAIKVDDTGVGGGVTDILAADGWNVLPVNALELAIDEEGYPNRRSELWFSTAERAMRGRLDVSRLDPVSLDTIRAQIMAPRWKQDSSGRRVVEPKADTKKRLGRSPDDGDGMNLAYAPSVALAVATTGGAPINVSRSTRDTSALMSLLQPVPLPLSEGGGRTLPSGDDDDPAGNHDRFVSATTGGEADGGIVGESGDPRVAYLRLLGGLHR